MYHIVIYVIWVQVSCWSSQVRIQDFVKGGPAFEAESCWRSEAKSYEWSEPLVGKSENRCRHCSLFRVSFTVLSLKNLYSLCKNEVPFGVSVNQQIFIKTNQ